MFENVDYSLVMNGNLNNLIFKNSMIIEQLKFHISGCLLKEWPSVRSIRENQRLRSIKNDF